MKITDFLGGLFRKKASGTIIVDNYRADAQTCIALEAFALFTTIELIAGLMSKCVFRTYRQGEEIRQHEWVNLNYRPNKNQNSTQFWQEVVCKLLYNRECLVVPWGEEKIIADSFQKDEYVLRETVFSNVTRGDFTFQRPFGMSDVYYFRYSNNDVQSIIDSIFGMYQTLISSASGKYIKAGKEKGILSISAKAQGDADFESKFKQLMENYFKSYFDGSVNSVLPLFDGFSYDIKSGTSTKYSNDVADINKLVDEAMARAAQAFKIPPALVRGDVAGIKDAYNIMLTNCIDPLADLISEELTSKQFSPIEIIHGNSIELDTSAIKHIDIFEIADKVDKLISCGFFSPDETREAAGRHATGEEWAQQHYMTKNYTSADMALKGGGDE
jgi:HK97 family phage portal protein